MNRTSASLSVAAIAIVVILLASWAVSTDDGIKTVKNDTMNIIGVEDDGVVTFKGIPYAEAPVGDLRFAPPVKKEMWTETLDCTEWGNAPVQSDSSVKNQDEDCLNLNIWAPADAEQGDNLPVYVWIHGGGMALGSGQEPCYDGSEYAKDGVIVVTIEYRLGALGFLALKTLEGEYGTTGNWGILDQIMALQWVHDNIYAFGGDNGNVTIGGESAGSFSVFYLILSPLTDGLFKNAIMESGAITYAIESAKGYDEAIAVSESFAEYFGVSDDEDGLAYLRSADASVLMDVSCFDINLMHPAEYSMWPVPDGVVIPSDILGALRNGEFKTDVNILMGYNAWEGLMFVENDEITEEAFEDYIYGCYTDPAAAELAIDYYNSFGDEFLYVKAARAVTSGLIKLGMEKAETVFADYGMNLYTYEFNYISDTGDYPTHGNEITYGFGLSIHADGTAMSAEDLKLMRYMHSYWTNFIKYGDPNGDGLPVWEQYTDEERTMLFDDGCTMGERTELWSFKTLMPLYFAGRD